MALIADRYPRYFHPPSNRALRISGLGAYSSEGDIDTKKCKAMGGIVNWKASLECKIERDGLVLTVPLKPECAFLVIRPKVASKE